MLLSPFYFRQHFGALPPSNHQYALRRVAGPRVAQGCVFGVRIERYWQTPSSRGRCNRRSTLSVCPPSVAGLTRNGNQSQALEEGRAGAVLWANGNQCKASVTEGTWENWVYLARAGGPVRAALPEGYPPVENLEPDGAPFPEILPTLTLRHVFIDRCLRFVRVCHAMSVSDRRERQANGFYLACSR